MRYHFQFVSRTTVRVELIAEDKRELALIDKLAQAGEDNEQLLTLFRKGVQTYSSNALLTKAKFMNFPRVALCNYTTATLAVENVA